MQVNTKEGADFRTGSVIFRTKYPTFFGTQMLALEFQEHVLCCVTALQFMKVIIEYLECFLRP